jgi:hypothetical protein
MKTTKNNQPESNSWMQVLINKSLNNKMTESNKLTTSDSIVLQETPTQPKESSKDIGINTERRRLPFESFNDFQNRMARLDKLGL